MFTHTNLSGVGVRWGVPSDWPELALIESLTSCYPWVESDFESARLASWPHSLTFVAEPEGLDRILGHMVLTWYAESVEISTLCVHPACQRAGVGTCLVLKLVSKVARDRERERRLIVARVPEQDLPRLKFFRQFGFKAVGLERGRRDDYGLDKVVMELRI